MTELSLFSPNAADVSLYRDGPREAVELSIPPASGSKGVRMRYLFDLEAHKAYTVNAITRACSWMRYVSDEPPFNYDPIAGAASLAADMSKQPPKFIGTERVNGIPARVAEFRGADGRVESRAWIAEPGGFLVKSEMVGGDGNVVTLLEVKKVDFAKRTDLSLDPPSSCDHQTAGEWSSTGLSAHEEASATAQGSGSVDLGTNQVRGEAHLEQPVTSKAPAKPGQTPASPATSAEPSKAQVTSVRSVSVRPRPDYKGEYPGQFDFVFAVTSDGPAEVKYVLVNQADRAWQSGTVSFTRAETKELVLPIKVGVRGQLFEGWTKLEVYSPNKIESERVPFSVDCRK
jgi:hypothetical protein